MRTAVRLVAALLVALWWTAALSGVAVAQADGPKTVGGSIIDFEIQVPTETLHVGDSIQWINNGQRPHTITDRGGMFDTGPIAPNGANLTTIPLTAAGTYFLFCEINPSRMNATIVVEPGPEPPAEVRIQALDEARDGVAKAFDPTELEVAAGARVILANVGGLRHSLTADDGSFDTGVLEPGAEDGRFHGNSTYVQVDEPGVYPFSCVIHPAAMQGVLTVTDEDVGEPAFDRDPVEPEIPFNAPVGTPAVAMRGGDGVGPAFEPTSISAAPGSAVTWSSAGPLTHTATFDDLELDTGTVVPGSEAALTMPEQPGTYSYFCQVHPAAMRAVVIVVPPDGLTTPGVAEGAGVAASGGTRTIDGETDGTALAYVVAVLVVGVGVVGLGLAVRRRSPAG